MKEQLLNLYLWYLRTLAKIQLLKNRPIIIGITGSAGKTSTRDAVALVLRTKYRCKVSEKANSHTGIPLDILGLHLHDYTWLDWLRVSLLAPIMLLVNWERYQLYIAEMGVDSPFEPKNMSYLLKIIQPDCGVFINALPVHSEPYDSLITATKPAERSHQAADLIAAEKGKMITSLPEKGFAILNNEDPRVAEFARRTKATVLTVGHHNSSLTIAKHAYSIDGFSLTVAYQQHKYRVDIPHQVLGHQYATTLSLGLAVGLAYGVDLESAAQALSQYQLPPGRFSLLPGINHSLILDSSYNASTQPTLDALAILHELKKQTNRPAVVVFGDMRELGQEAAHEHHKVAEHIASFADQVVLVGPLTQQFVLPTVTEKLGSERVRWFANSAQAAADLPPRLPPDAIDLAKGSQNTIFLERVVEALLVDPTSADHVLCRRGEYWDNIRAQFT